MSKNKKTAVIYARYSSDHQREESIEGQIRVCKEFASRQDITIIGTYTDRAMSAKTAHRPEFLRMIRDSASKAFDYVIVYQLDRFSRNRYDSAIYKARLRKNNVKVLSAMENISDDPSGILMESVLEGMAEYYSAELAQKIKRGMTENILSGRWAGGTVPCGYKLSPDKRLLLNDNAGAVKLAFEKYLEGYSKKSIAEILNQAGYRQNTGKQFTQSTIKVMLANEKYTGVLTWRDVRVPDVLPQIISPEMFAQVQASLKRRFKKTGGRSEQYLLCAKLRCGKCGANYIGSSAINRHKMKYYYYTCMNRRKHSTCDGKNHRQEVLENFVIDHTVALLKHPKMIELIAEQCMKLNTNDDAIEKERLTEKLTAAKKKMDNYLDAIASGVNAEGLKDRIAAVDKEISGIESRLSELQLTSRGFNVTKEHIMFFLEKIIAGDLRTESARRKIIDAFIREIVIYDDKIEISYNYKSELPTLPNVEEVESSRISSVVDHQGFEPWTP